MKGKKVKKLLEVRKNYYLFRYVPLDGDHIHELKLHYK